MEKQKRPWAIGFGPIELAPGQTRRVDTQPKCTFFGEGIVSANDNAGIHLLAIYVGQKEILGLNGDSIDLGREEILIEECALTNPALPMEVELVNRTAETKKVYFDIVGNTIN